jgi:hypothetical protein
MRVPYSMKLVLATLAAGVLTACGGGGGGLQDVADTPVTISVVSGSNTANAGTSFLVSASAVSKPKAMKTMTWSVTALTAGAAAMTLSNADCANGTRSTRTTNGITQSNWACDALATAPAVTFDSTYRLSFSGADEAGNTSSGYRDVTVTASAGGGGGGSGPTGAAPVATTPGNVAVTAGDDVGLNCFATGGTVAAGSKYVFQWVIKSNPNGLPLTLTAGADGAVSFKAPAVKSQASVTLQCRVTDDALLTAVSDTLVTIAPNGTVNAIANAGATQSVEQNTTVILDGSASSAPGNPALFYKWTQVEGPTVALSNDSAAKPTFVTPAVMQTTRLTFQLAAMVTSPANPALAAPSELATVSVYVLPQDPLSLAISAASVVQTGTAVSLTATVTPAGGVYYAWTQVSGPTVTIGGANTAVASFIAPDVVGSYVDSVFSVSVSRKPLAQALPSEIVTADVVVRTTP